MCQACHYEVIGSKGGKKKNLILVVNLNLRSPQTASSLGEMQTVSNLLLNRNFQWLRSKASLSSNVAQKAGLSVGIGSTGLVAEVVCFMKLLTDGLSVSHHHSLLS